MAVHLGFEVKFYVYHYQHKSEPYRAALEAAGHKEDRNNPDVVLIDRDHISNDNVSRPEVARYPRAVVMVYPHSAMPPWWYDGIVKIDPRVKCIFVVGEGQKRAAQIIVPGARVESVGWAWCGLREFQKPEQVKRILFAPIHPGGGRLRPEAIEANEKITNELISLSHDYKVTIRYLGSRFRQGIAMARTKPQITMIQGLTDGSTNEIDAADLVIAEGSMMYLAVARGKPTIGINQHLPCRPNKHSEIHTPRNWDKYGPGIAYPINYGDAPLEDLIQLAASAEQTQWRRDFIGEAFNPQMFAAKVEQIWRENVK